MRLGGLYSSTNDLFKFASATLNHTILASEGATRAWLKLTDAAASWGSGGKALGDISDERPDEEASAHGRCVLQGWRHPRIPQSVRAGGRVRNRYRGVDRGAEGSTGFGDGGRHELI